MIPTGSRYEQAEREFTEAHIYNEFGYPYLEGDVPNLKIHIDRRDTTYLLFPIASGAGSPMLNYFVKDDEGYQWLGYKFSGDSTKWWEIAAVNPQVWYPLDLKMGDYIGVPVTT